jgi:hypothetical protein
MECFRLEPVAGTEADARWKATRLREGCWIRAKSEEHARRIVEVATVMVVDRKKGDPALYSPWIDPNLTSCITDEPSGRSISDDGTVVSIGGQTFS